jgi:NAD(P)-dependent dehydrogenase (short-subunit alcohol dehydrogenase family)
MACRSEEKAREAIHRLRETLSFTSNINITYLPLDLSSLSSIHTSAARFLEKEERLDVLFCNAGVMVPDRREVTKEGYDMQFGVNVLGHHVLVGLLVSNIRPGKNNSSA